MPSVLRGLLAAQVFHIDRPLGLREQQGTLAAGDGLRAYHALFDICSRRDLEHDLCQDLLDQRSQSAGAGLELQGSFGRCLEASLARDPRVTYLPLEAVPKIFDIKLLNSPISFSILCFAR